jgi:hypothetical protein
MPSGEHRTEKTRTTFIIVKETREISSGRNARTGQDYTMWQLVATKPDGTMIPQNLRAFEDMPRGEVLEVSVTPFVSEQWGTSYTVARKDKSKLHSDFDALKARVERLEKLLNVTEETTGAPPPPATAGPPPLPPTSTANIEPPPLAATPRQADGEIPF